MGEGHGRFGAQRIEDRGKIGPAPEIELRRSAARGRAGWGAALKPAIAVAVVVTAITFFITPGMTQSSFANMGYWVDWGNLLLYAAAFGAVGGALAWPLAAMMRRA